MAFGEKVRTLLTKDSMLPAEQQIDSYVRDRILRAEERQSPLLPQINERYEMWRGNQYAYTDSAGKLAWLPTKTTKTGGGKRPWLSRSVNNLLIDIVAHEVAAVTQRIPGYEVAPTSVDPEKRSAAKVSEQVLIYGYDRWSIQHASVKAVTHAVVGQSSFAWPYFDTSVGPMIRGRDGVSVVGRGEVKVKIFGPQDVMWEPGIRFEDSPYHVVVQDSTLQEIVNMPGFLGEAPTPEAKSARSGGWSTSKAHNTDLVRVYSYLEKPTKTYAIGRWITIANGRVIAAEQHYPVPEGDALLPLSYIVDPDNDRDMSLVQHLLDPMRIYNDAWNKIVEWKNLAINPQLFVAPGVLQGQVITSEPGAVYEIADPTNNIRWREIPAFPQELFQIAQEANSVMARIAAQNDIPQQVEAGKAIQTLIERDQARRQSFISQVAQWHARVGSRNLLLTQQYYNEPRLLSIKGRWSPEVIKDFKGAKIDGQIDVRVSPGSVEPRTRAAMEQKVLAFADRGWITAEQAMSAIEGGYGADLVTSYELDIGRATRIIARLKAGTDALYGTPDAPTPDRLEVDPNTGLQTQVPDFMPRTFDNIPVQRAVFEDWMKTEEFESLSADLQTAAMDIYNAMVKIEADKAAQAQMAQDQAAAAKGAQNAAGAFGGQPDAPSPTAGGGDLPTPNQPANQNVPQRGQQ